MAKRRRLDVNPQLLYAACKHWVEIETESMIEPHTLAETWNRAVAQSDNGSRFRRFIIHCFKVDTACEY